jgi:HAD superfamily hydrolase (TIGR01549 family)
MDLRAVIFDLDGTVVHVSYDWDRIRNELETRGVPILAYLDRLAEPERSRKLQILEKYEDEATSGARLRRGMRKLLEFLARNGLKRVLVTNNRRENVDFLLKKFRLDFDWVMSRESRLWKPSGAPFRAVMKRFGLTGKQCAVVGDSPFDVRAAADAGIENVFLLGGRASRLPATGSEVFPSVGTLQRRLEHLLSQAQV